MRLFATILSGFVGDSCDGVVFVCDDAECGGVTALLVREHAAQHPDRPATIECPHCNNARATASAATSLSA